MAAGRADAQRNRAHLLDVAAAAFAEDGTTSLNEIAKRAGVGAGTLYRHFPTREALILAVYQHDISRLVDSVEAVLAAYPGDPLAALRAWYIQLANYVRLKHGLGEALHTAAARAVIDESHAPVAAATATLLDACAAVGAVRPGLDPADVMQLMGFLWRVSDDPRGRAQADRLLDLAIDALRPR
ncbi:TetR family transcriptional regulator [Frankia sp. CcI49]|uniref:TetR/AcrR family transcriptional regulator n=1 Tax=Frankia sp. CcI49 TaxID=1745382 RepID=UPI0009772B5F|nr:TetR/AcrR family transcriptional regulator [Frankia sp. CcI49]ONH59428.1 TetR family transcriptional regulator [Frankia sp. CcI49]